LDGDRKRDFIIAEKNNLRITAGGKTAVIIPYGEKYTGGLSFAFGDVNGDGVKEVVVAPEDGRGGEIRVYRYTGELVTLPWRAFGERYSGGANVAVGDLNGDAISEVIVGAGQGGGPQVRIFSSLGKLLSAGFFAYDLQFRGGVRVSAGDVNGDGKDEIVTGPGPGASPEIKIFDSKGKSINPGFFAFDPAGRRGVEPQVVDLDGDGKMEILGTTAEVFGG
jgi:hypothetical protein